MPKITPKETLIVNLVVSQFIHMGVEVNLNAKMRTELIEEGVGW